MTDSQRSQISEYAHAGTKPIAHVSDDNEPTSCAIDLLNGDLAVANYADNVSVFPHASGNPVVYTAPDFYNMQFCSYDASGNLYLDGNRGTHQGFEPAAMLWLSYGSTRLQRF